MTSVTRNLSEKRDLDKKAKIRSMGQSELSAYLVSARFLLSFLEDFCQDEGLDLAGPRQRLGELEAFGSGC